MRTGPSILCLSLLLAVAPVRPQPAAPPAPAPMPPLSAPWNEGAADCAAHPQPPLEVRAYDAHTYILRESLCATFEAPFIYLLIGSAKALLIDTGDVADPALMPLAQTVFKLLPGEGAYRMPLLVAHSHRHLDHRAGDAQFEHQPKVHVVPYDLDGMRRYFGFGSWPEGQAQIDLGDRMVDVIPAPGHNSTELVYYDRGTTLLFSGDLLMPGRLLIEDSAVDLASAQRVAAFVKKRPVAAVLGGHIEFDAQGGTYLWGSHYHPQEHTLPLGKDDVLGLPDAVARFNGFYTVSGPYVMMNSTRVLAALAGAAALVVVLAAFLLVRWLRRHWRAWRERRALMNVMAVPPDPRLRELLPGCGFADSYRVAAPAAPASLRELSQAALASPPRWAGWLMDLRNAVARRLGLKTEAAADDLRPAGRIGMFPVLAESPGEMLLGLDDRHLDFRIALSLVADSGPESRESRQLTVTTLVRTNNRLGRVYLAVILPFHRLIVRGMLKRAARAWHG